MKARYFKLAIVLGATPLLFVNGCSKNSANAPGNSVAALSANSAPDLGAMLSSFCLNYDGSASAQLRFGLASPDGSSQQYSLSGNVDDQGHGLLTEAGAPQAQQPRYQAQITCSDSSCAHSSIDLQLVDAAGQVLRQAVLVRTQAALAGFSASSPNGASPLDLNQLQPSSLADEVAWDLTQSEDSIDAGLVWTQVQGTPKAFFEVNARIHPGIDRMIGDSQYFDLKQVSVYGQAGTPGSAIVSRVSTTNGLSASGSQSAAAWVGPPTADGKFQLGIATGTDGTVEQISAGVR